MQTMVVKTLVELTLSVDGEAVHGQMACGGFDLRCVTTRLISTPGMFLGFVALPLQTNFIKKEADDLSSASFYFIFQIAQKRTPWC